MHNCKHAQYCVTRLRVHQGVGAGVPVAGAQLRYFGGGCCDALVGQACRAAATGMRGQYV